MRRWRKILLWVAAIVVGLPVALIVALLVLANTGFGQRLIARQAGSMSGGMVRLAGLHGRFPDALRLDHVEVDDSKGAWLTADGVALDWSPLTLVSLRALVERVSVEHLSVTRLPVAAPAAKRPPASSGGFSLPVRVTVRALQITRADLAAPVAGVAAALKIGGSADVVSLQQGTADLGVDRLDKAGTYRLDATLTQGAISAKLSAAEPGGGLISEAARLPDLGGIVLNAAVTGPKTAEATHLTLQAGQLTAQVQGLVDLTGQSATLDVTASAPAMRPRPDIGWQSIDVQAHVRGKFTAPDATAHVLVRQLAAGGASLQSLAVDGSGDRGRVDVHAVLTGTRLPGARPDLFADAPIDVTGAALLDKPERPVTFRLTHKLLTADGHATTAGDISGQIHTVVPDIAPLAALGNVDLQGSTDAVAKFAMHDRNTQVSVTGTADFTGGQAPVPTLLGKTTFAAAALLAGQDMTVQSVQVDGRGLHAHAAGTDRPAGLDLNWTLGLTDLALAAPQMRGAAEASGHVRGPQSGLAVTADIKGDVGTDKIAKGPVQAALNVGGLPTAPTGSLEASGRLDGAPLTLSADIRRDAAGVTTALLKQASWKSLTATADLTLPAGKRFPEGKIEARMSRLADVSALVGQELSGGLTASIVSKGQGAAADTKIAVLGTDLGVQGSRIGALKLDGRVTGADARPDVDLVLTADGIQASGVTGELRATAKGTQEALALGVTAALQNVDRSDGNLAATARLDVPGKIVLLQSLQADAKGLTARLLAPARVNFSNGLAVDRLRLALGNATAEIAGRISPALDVTASLRNLTPELAKPFVPGLNAQGVLTADARLTGTTTAPQGNVRVSATGVKARSGPAASVPAAQLLATMRLNGGAAAVDAKVSAGPKLRLSADGTVPLRADGALNMRGTGNVDLSLLDPILQAGGRAARGQMALDVAVTGSATKPSLNGNFTLANGEIQDFVQGLRISNISALVQADGNTVRIVRFEGHAGTGTIDVAGTVGALAPGLPLDVHITASKARPLASDLLTATLDADVTLRGQAGGAMEASGKIKLEKVEINIPESFPPSVAVLNVRRPGYKPPPAPAAAPSAVRLALTVDAPSNIFVRGHGLDAEMGGTLHVGGLATAPLISGAFDMRYGSFSLAGTTLTFSKGTVGFNGAGVENKIDPTLDFEADSYQGGITATLMITGYADAPKIALSSVPDLPQDEVLAHLLFGESVKQLSAIQLAEIGAALAELTGVTGGGNPLDSVRKGLGLDRLSVGGGTNGAGASIEAGRYVAKGVFVGAKQATAGAGGTQAEVQVDLTRHLKVQTTLGTGGGSTQGATPQNDPGSSVGLSYQFEY
jgi:translocation and assembly module TamB